MDESHKYASEILDAPLVSEMRRSYLDYAMSVIVGRALPDARDGMKPVHRRILHAMNEIGNAWNKAYKKSARIVGDTIGKYHPHGDIAVYETMVRMAQTFSLRYPLIDGQGNFGSVDGDSAAAMRYTEVRLSKIAHMLLSDIDMETIDFGPNYDGSEQEPLVLPTRLPNLLLNGSEGIAVGMATKIPPHNLRELIDACLVILRDADVSVDDLLKIVPAPDFPTGGLICGLSGSHEALRTGRGSVVIRARTHIEEDAGRSSIVVDELPYQVNKKTLQEKIARLVMDKEIDGISNIQDESDKSGMRLVIELKRGEIPDVVLNQLFKRTDLQITFGVNMVALVDGAPHVINLREALDIFLAHRREVVVRRTIFELRKARFKGHILEGYAVALSNVDEIVELIKAAKDPAEARINLLAKAWASKQVESMLSTVASGALATKIPECDDTHGMKTDGYHLTPIQANEILQLRLQRLTGMEQDKIEADYRQILLEIDDFEDILRHDERVRGIISEELTSLRAEFGDDRKSEVVFGVGDIDDEDLIPRRAMIVTYSQGGYIKTQSQGEYASQHRGGRGKMAADLKADDQNEALISAASHDRLMCFTNTGRVLPIKVYSLPEGGRASRGRPIQNFIPLEPGEQVEKILPVSEFAEDTYLVLATRQGVIKRTSLHDYRNIRSGGLIAIDLDPGDTVVEAMVTDGNCDFTLFCSNGRAARFSEQELRVISRGARGVRGMRIPEGEAIVSVVHTTSDDDLILIVSETGYAKRTPVGMFRKCRRGSIGVRAMAKDERVGKIAQAVKVAEELDVIAITNAGVMIRIPSDQVRQTSRGAIGVRLLKLDEGQTVSSVTVCDGFAPEPEIDADAEEGAEAAGLNDDGGGDDHGDN